MPQYFKVSKAFLSTDQNTKEVQVVNTQGGPAHKWMVQVENQPVQGWFSVLKKPGNEVKPGDELYGDIVQNQFGKPQFNRAQEPYGAGRPAAQAAPVAAPAAHSGGCVDEELHAKVDFLIRIVEQLLESNGQTPPDNTTSNTDPENPDLGPLDLSEIPY